MMINIIYGCIMAIFVILSAVYIRLGSILDELEKLNEDTVRTKLPE